MHSYLFIYIFFLFRCCRENVLPILITWWALHRQVDGAEKHAGSATCQNHLSLLHGQVRCHGARYLCIQVRALLYVNLRSDDVHTYAYIASLFMCQPLTHCTYICMYTCINISRVVFVTCTIREHLCRTRRGRIKCHVFRTPRFSSFQFLH